MMDLNEDLSKSDFFDLVPLPVTLIDSIQFGNQPDANNNSTIIPPTQLKSFIDEMLLTDSLNNNNNGPDGQTLELLGAFQWSHGTDPAALNVSHQAGLALDPSTNWHPGGEGEVTTLTNLLDPLFVSFEDSKMDQYFSTSNPTVISSDLISSTFLTESSSHSPSTSESDILTWSTTTVGKGGISDGLCDDSLLRTALQSRNKNYNLLDIPTTVLSISASSDESGGEMTELRKVLSFPPLLRSCPSSPSSSVISPSSQSPFYELKVLDTVYHMDDSGMPNVEELMGGCGGRQEEINSSKINSSSGSLSAKWTLSDPAKIRRRTKKKKVLGDNKGTDPSSTTTTTTTSTITITGAVIKSNKSSEDEQKSPSSPPQRKERSLHYCNICSKGFKDKYSVNVHVRTHTGEKPFACSLCGKNFRQKAHLAKHYQTHAAKANNANANNNNNNNNNSSTGVVKQVVKRTGLPS